MRIPVLAPSVLRNRRGAGRRRGRALPTEYGVRPSQYDEAEGDTGEEDEENGDEIEGADEGESVVDSD